MIKIKTKNSFIKTERYLNKIKDVPKTFNYETYAEKGLEALQNATPIDTGKTSKSWFYKIVRGQNNVKIQYFNSNIVDGVNIAVILQYGHGTSAGEYIEGIDYINPALDTVFSEAINDMFKEVNK